ncbi:MAG: DUF5343 domain-containing protein [Gemmatimonadetes bacterium]|nr:DUF5343 domain-containing protein [Gemmatimonadota bacterium]
MASEKTNYPYLPARSWWALRKKFHQTIPTQVTPRYLATVLGGQESSARGNVLPALRAVGLVAEDGTTTERAKLWRDDTGYPEVCRQMREEIYPSDLLDALPGPAIDQEAAKRWFMATTGCGEQAARKKAAMYTLLALADPAQKDEDTPGKPEKSTPTKSKRPSRTSVAAEKQDSDSPEPDSSSQVPNVEMPEMRLSVEIRIDASATPEQIDQIFASMAKHLYGRDDEER